MRTAAAVGCAILIAGGVTLLALDAKTAPILAAAADGSPTAGLMLSTTLSMWKWGVGCAVAGVSGFVLLALSDRIGGKAIPPSD